MTDPTDLLNSLADGIQTTPTRPPGSTLSAPFRLGQIISVDGLGDQPPTVTLGDDEAQTEARLGINVWDIQPYDTVIYVTNNATPVIIGRLTGGGSSTLLAEDSEDDPEPWHIVGAAGEPAFAGTWVNYGVPWMTARFRKQEDGWVKLEGLVKGGAGSSVIFTLPPDFAPDRNLTFTSTSALGYCQLYVNTNGEVRHGSDGVTSSDIGLSDIFFPTKINRAALIHSKLESQWQSDYTDPRETVTTYLRSDGWCWWTGIARNTSYGGTAEFILARIDSRIALNPLGQVIGCMSNAGNCSRLNVGGSDSSTLHSPCSLTWQNPGGALITAIVLGGMNYWAETGANVTWNTVTYLNGWVKNPGDYTDVQYHCDPHGMVYFRGLANGASKTSNVIFNLPVGCRPSANLAFKAIRSGNVTGRVDVAPNGDVTLNSAGTGYYSLAGVCFFAEQ